MKRLYLAGFAALVLPGLAAAATPTKASAEHAIAAAEAKIKLSAAHDNQWPSTLAALKSAKAAEKKSDFATAETEAKRAEMLAGLSLQQAVSQKKLWKNAVVH